MGLKLGLPHCLKRKKFEDRTLRRIFGPGDRK
jgi:hypothetical protein